MYVAGVHEDAGGRPRNRRQRDPAEACPGRLGERANLRLHDVEQSLDFIDDVAFDGIVCALVLHHVANRAQLLSELRRVLRPGGWLLISTSHPTSDRHRFGGSYYAEDWVDLPVAGGEQSIHYQRMSLETFLAELLDSGFVLERLVEPRPTAALRDLDESAYRKLQQSPSFLAVRLRRS
ncbi:class I SAM-dependent methyltransferase [Pseudonocardia sp. MH-G8]|uniref:class I SAM-dependent methyltransferase n=1 Tax=Pseudonocardia sp. MH-G8 TaxID=1854588 RepID=UPI000BA17447|nr:class I SAM-dependent methyltransferase [Pseudonocardia sp. MH-G8]OZM83592.1 hypothetical protein CFP66_03565 [Pseudonocardia sp. MH-G8]